MFPGLQNNVISKLYWILWKYGGNIDNSETKYIDCDWKLISIVALFYYINMFSFIAHFTGVFHCYWTITSWDLRRYALSKECYHCIHSLQMPLCKLLSHIIRYL